MAGPTRFAAGVGVGDGGRKVSNASAVHTLRATFDPTSATQVLLGTLPVNARVIDVVANGGATGGTNPTVDIGTIGDDDGFANELDCDAAISSAVAAATAGALIGDLLTTATAVYGKVGASAATGGTSIVFVHFTTE